MADAASLHLEMFDTVSEFDPERLRALLHPDYTYTSSDGVEQPGADAGIAVAETYMHAFPDMTFTVRNQWTPTENVSILELTARGTHKETLEGIPATGRVVEIPLLNIVEVRDGLIYRERDYFDTLVLMRQLGVAED